MIAIAIALYVVVTPFVVARYPMMTDLPFHAANASILRHHADAAWHFREQFALQPFAIPYLGLYLVAAAAMTFVSPVVAIKIAAVVMLLLLPAGLAVLAWGMGKSPILGLSAVALAWGGLTHWGFLNFLGALGLFAMALGVALRQLARPRRRRAVVLSALLVAVFFTHPFRFPFAIAAVAGAGLLHGRRWRAVAPALVPPLAVFALWWHLRPPALDGELSLAFHGERLGQIGRHVFGGLLDAREAAIAVRALTILLIVIALGALGAIGRARRGAWRSHLCVAACAAVFLALYLVLPLQIGLWWYVFPREITSAIYLGLALVPDLPRGGRLPFALAAAVALVPFGQLAVEHHAAFDRETRDFTAITQVIEPAPKLLYLVFDHTGSGAARSPFMHLPAYVQAEKGGWLSFHFAVWDLSPVVYRDRDEPGAVVPPPVPLRWEWTPQRFSVLEHGPFFDWFLVRSRRSPAFRFAADPTIELVAQEGRWWLFRRR